MKAKWVTLVLFAMLALVVRSTSAETLVTGTLTASQHWTESGSPYVLSGGVILQQDLEFLCDAGTIVRFELGASLRLRENVQVRILGTATRPVLFTSNAESPNIGDHGGIRIDVGTQTELHYCVIEYGGIGLSMERNVAAESVRIQFCTNGLIIYGYYSPSITVTGFEVSDCQDGVWVRSDVPTSISNIEVSNCITGLFADGWALRLDNSIFRGNGFGVSMWGTIENCTVENSVHVGLNLLGVDTVARNCTITQNGGWGAHVQNGMVENCTIENNGGTGLVLDGTYIVQGCTIRFNGNSGVMLGPEHASDALAISGNNIVRNTPYDMEVVSGCGIPVIDATGNYWGTSDISEISLRIRDANDDPTLVGTVDYIPCEESVETEFITWGAVKSLFK